MMNRAEKQHSSQAEGFYAVLIMAGTLLKAADLGPASFFFKQTRKFAQRLTISAKKFPV
jgi:hypothetical protein